MFMECHLANRCAFELTMAHLPLLDGRTHSQLKCSDLKAIIQLTSLNQTVFLRPDIFGPDDIFTF